MTSPMLTPALQYHKEGLCPIPVVENNKMPALSTWEEYFTRRSTEAEVREWWGNGHNWNVGLVHRDGYITLDIDHDLGLFESLKHLFPQLFTGRLEQSGSGEGYHIPLKLDKLPDFGTDVKHQRPRGNRTWKTSLGACNVRIGWCQTVAPPSIHPSGQPYRFIQEGNLTALPDIDAVVEWLNEMAPPPQKEITKRVQPRGMGSDTLIEAVKAAWPDTLTVFEYFGMGGNIRQEHNGEWRLLGNGGLLLTEDRQQWYCFSDEVGGDATEAWGYCRFGSAYDRRRQFRQVLLEMALAAGVDIARFWRRGDEVWVDRPKGEKCWTQKFGKMWGNGRLVEEVVF